MVVNENEASDLHFFHQTVDEHKTTEMVMVVEIQRAFNQRANLSKDCVVGDDIFVCWCIVFSKSQTTFCFRHVFFVRKIFFLRLGEFSKVFRFKG